jgi:predicted Zn-dependent peptidase
LIDRFNQMNRVGGGMTLDASNFAVQASMNAQTSGAKNETSKESIVDQIKQLKELLDAGVLTKEEFQKAKKQILN